MASAKGRIKDRILALLAAAGRRVDDDQIASRIGIVRQQVYDRCHHLARSGPIIRGRGTDGKIVNRRVRSSPSPAKPCRTKSKRQPKTCASTPHARKVHSAKQLASMEPMLRTAADGAAGVPWREGGL